jgi:hypothetical protein
VKVIWRQGDPEFPILLYSELDRERWETRKLEVFADGHCRYADSEQEVGDTGLGLVPFPSIEQLASDPEYEPFEISKDEFEKAWSQRVGNWDFAGGPR